MHEPSIATVIRYFRPGWEPPEDTGREWERVLCPFHAESRPSAAVSFQYNAFNCLSCGVKGDAKSLLRKQGGLTTEAINRFAESVLAEGDNPVPPKPARVSRRKVFGDTGADRSEYQGGGQQVPTRVRRRTYGGA